MPLNNLILMENNKAVDTSTPIQIIGNVIDLDQLRIFFKQKEAAEEAAEKVEPIVKPILSINKLIKSMDLTQAIQILNSKDEEIYKGSSLNYSIYEKDMEVKHISVKSGRIIIWV